MPYTTINKGSSYFNTILYTGTGSSLNVTGLNFKPDWVWTKFRSASNSHYIFDAVRGTNKVIFSDGTYTEATISDGLNSFNSDGFTLGTNVNVNQNGTTFVSWNWLGANTTVSNTSGTITSTVSANTTSGFSIVSYTGNGTSGATVGHGLGVAPKMIIVKNRTRVDAWPVDCRAVSGIMYLNETGALGSYGSTEPFVSTAPTSTVFSLGSAGNTNFNTSSLIAYCFAEIKGFSKFGSYTGNGSSNGTFVYTGFKPAFVMVKSTGAGANWLMQNNKTLGYNPSNAELYANLTNAEVTADRADLLSNGFKARINSGENNSSGVTYIYMAFAENPFVTSGGIPVTAR
jgi:hypothetical protein